MVGIGGISLKSPFVIQTLADVLEMPIKVVRSEQTCTLGAVIFASVVAGVYDCVQDAQDALGQGYICEYYPNEVNRKVYENLYQKYRYIGRFSENFM